MSDPGREKALSVDLPEAERDRILAKAQALESQTDWQVLGVPQGASAVEIKRAYFELSKQFHPDRYFGKAIGLYGDLLTRIFRRLKEAYEALSKQADGPAAPATPAQKLRSGPSEAELEAHRQRILEARKKKAGPARDAPAPAKEPIADKAAEAYTAALRKLRDKDYVGAAALFREALTHDPTHKDAKHHFEEVERELAIMRAARLAEAAEGQAEAGNKKQAGLGFVQAFQIAPSKVRYLVRGGELLMHAGSASEALAAAEQALRGTPRLFEATLLLIEACMRTGALERARGELDGLTSFERKDPRATKLEQRLAELLKAKT